MKTINAATAVFSIVTLYFHAVMSVGFILWILDTTRDPTRAYVALLISLITAIPHVRGAVAIVTKSKGKECSKV
jgi:hypothetical protein